MDQLTGVTREKTIANGWIIKLSRAGNQDKLSQLTETASEEFMNRLNEVLKSFNQLGRANATSTTSQATGGFAEEIRKLKELADDGIISQAEFEMKKQELLGRI